MAEIARQRETDRQIAMPGKAPEAAAQRKDTTEGLGVPRIVGEAQGMQQSQRLGGARRQPADRAAHRRTAEIGRDRFGTVTSGGRK